MKHRGYRALLTILPRAFRDEFTEEMVAVFADQDVLVPPRFSHELASRIPGAELVVIPGSGHVALWEHPDAFTEVCLTFLAKHSTA